MVRTNNTATYRILITTVLICSLILVTACIANYEIDTESTAPQIQSVSDMETTKRPTATIQTTKGNIVLELFTDLMPITTKNFIDLSQQGFYDGTIIHRVIPQFMIQAGDPTGTGTGGPGYTIEDEFVEHSQLSNKRATIAMANAGPQTGGSQFFINIADNTYLDWDKPPAQSKHPVFGRVISGMEVVDAISEVARDSRDKPLQEIRIINVVIVTE